VSTYREIIGKKIKKVSSDPSSGTEGEMWYNSTTGTLRGPAILSAWTSGGPLVSIAGDVANLGTQTASLCAGGSDNPTAENVDITQEGNGTGFSLGGTLNTARRGCAGFGTQTAGVCFGGYSTTYTNVTEEYNGTAWTNGNNTPVSPGTASWCSGGTLTAGIGYTGSYLGPPSPSNNAKQTIEYDGTNWADANQLTRSGGDGANGFGIQTAALCAGQASVPGSPSASTLVEEYDGTNWASGTVLPTAAAYGGSGGIQTAGMIFGGGSDGSPGYPTKVTTTQSWNGTSWTTVPSLATARMGTQGGPVGSNTASQLMGGNNGSTNLTNVENFDSSLNTITAAAWASGGNMNTARSQIAGMGIVTAALAAGGYQYGPNAYTAVAEEYDGSTWTNIPSMPVTLGFRSGAGTTTAGLAIAGHDNTSPTSTSEWNGSAWTAGGNVNAGGIGSSGNGTQTAAWLAGSGETPSRPNTATEEYDGSSWTSVPGALNTGRGYCGASGPQTDGTFMGGATPSPAYNNTEEYNGTAWTNSNTLAVPMSMMANSGGSAPSNSIMAAGSANISTSATTQQTDGSTWYTSAALSTARGTARACGAGANADSSLCAGGNSPSINSTEEFTAGTTAANIETFTTS